MPHQLDNEQMPHQLENTRSLQSILWRGIDMPGHDACRLTSQDREWHLSGAAVFSHVQKPCRLDYHVVCDQHWNTVLAKVSGWLGNDLVELELTVGADRKWRMNGVEQPAVAGCIDVDLNFSPSTNLLPIRRLNLEINQGAEVNVAWLRFPGFELEALPQIYKRIDQFRYHYESGGGSFVAELKVNAAGFVTDYPELFQAESWT
jgi:hypothetical protein